MKASPTPKLMAALPEALWPEATRRLRRAPELWALASDEAILPTLAALRTASARWRPGPLALAIYALRHLDGDPTPELTLLGKHHERLAAAYARLLAPDQILDPIDDALPAALALRLRGQATTDWHAIAADAAAQPERWRLTLQYLAGLEGVPEAFWSALLEQAPASAELAASPSARKKASNSPRSAVWARRL